MPEKKIGVLDPEGKKDNPLTGKPYQNLYQEDEVTINGKKYPATYRNYSKIVHDQPLLEDIRHTYEILDKLRNHQVLVIESATGTGKTVVLPKLAAHLVDYKERVVVTVPKRSLAKSSAGFCARCMDVRLGDEVGFAHSGSVIEEDIINEDEEVITETRGSFTKETKIMFVTDGWLSRKVSEDLTLKDYGVIMIDEVHERNERIDILLLKIREALMVNDKLRVIITSATLDMDLFVNYFKSKGISVASKSVSKETNFNVKEIFLNKKVTGQNIVQEALDTYDKYLNQKGIKEDTIIFINSNTNAKSLCDKLTQLNKKIYCIQATSTTIENDSTLEDRAKNDPQKDPYLKELYESKGYDRRVIIATEVWESSITLPLLKYVIEPGIALVSDYNGQKMMYCLLNQKITQGQILQRKGRVGRSSDGTCIYLYSKETFNKLPFSKTPGILKKDFSEILLSWWRLDNNETLGEVISYTMNLIDTPKPATIKNSLKSLYSLDYSNGNDNRDNELTELGYFLSDQKYFKSDIKYTKALYYASYYGCKDEISTIIAILGLKRGVSDLFLSCKKSKDCVAKLKRFRNPGGDLLAGYGAFLAYQNQLKNTENFNNYKIEKWCQDNYLDRRQLEKVREDYYKIVRTRYPHILFEESGEEKIQFNNLHDKICYCLLKGFYINLAVKKGKYYENTFPASKTRATLSNIIELDRKNKFNFMTKESKYIIYDKLQKFDTETNFSNTMAIPDHIIVHLTPFEKELINI